MGVDISELENAVTAFQKLKAAHSDWTDDKVKTEAMSQSLLNASDAAIHFAETTELTSENIGKFKVQQEAAIEAIEKGSLASKAASIGAGLLTGALTSVGVAIVSLLATQFLEWLDGVIHKQEKLAEKTEALRGEYESLTSEIKSLQSELNGIDAKISAMNGKPLTITEQGELTELQLQRKELEQILAVKEKLAEEKRTEASNAAVEYFQNESHYNDMYGGTFKGTILDDTKYKIESMKELQQQISDARETLQEYAETYGVTSYEYNTAKTDLDNLQGTYENLSAAVSKNMEAINEHRESLYGDGDEVKNTRDAIDELTNDWLHFDNELGEAYSKFLDKNSFDGLDRKFKQMATDGTLSADVIRQYEDFTRLLEQSGFTAEEAAQHYKAAGEAAQKAVPPSIDLSSADGLKTKLTEIIEKANVLSAMDINQAALSGGSEKQKEAWAELQAVMAETGMTLEQIQEKAVELGIVGADGASNITQAFIDANQNSAVFANNLSQITNRTDTLVSAYKELSKGQQLSSNVIMNLIQAYPQLETELTEYLAGLRSQQQIMADLEAVYQADSENWKALMLAKMGNSETFFQSIIVGNEGWVKEFYNQYGVDLSQCQTYAKAKLQIFQTITTAAYAAARATSGMGNMQGPLPYNAVSDELLAASDAIEQAINDLNNISMGSLEGQFHSLNSAIDSTTNKANDAAQALQSIASTSLSAINGLLDMTMSMLKQDLQSEKDRIDGELQGIEEEYQNSKDSIAASKDAALKDIEAQRKALQAKKKAQDKAYDDQIKHLQKLKDAQNDIYDDQIKAAEDELDAYNKIIDAQLKLLRLKEEQHDYERELADKQKDVADIEAQLAELGLDDSIEAQKKRLELEEELAEKREELDEFQHDKNVSDQEQALEDEREAFEEKQQAIIDGIQSQKDAYNEMIDAQIEGIREAKEAFDESIQAQLDALADQKEQTQAYYDQMLANEESSYQARKALKEQEKADIEKKINDTATLRKQAIELIQEKSDDFYKRLLEWNRQYGTGIDADVIVKWNNAYTALEIFGGKQFNVLEVMNELTLATNNFNTSLEEAVEKAGRLADALDRAISKQNNVVPPDFGFQPGASPGSRPYQGSAGTFHSGGEVGKDNLISGKKFSQLLSNLKTDELPAILKKREWVLTEEQQSDLYQYTQVQTEIIGAFERMYQAVSNGISNLPSINTTSLLDLPDIPELAAVGGDNNAVFNFNTTITGNADDDVMNNWFNKNVSAFEDRFARYTLGQVNFKRSLRTNR